jgi:hypothetical protein
VSTNTKNYFSTNNNDNTVNDTGFYTHNVSFEHVLGLDAPNDVDNDFK